MNSLWQIYRFPFLLWIVSITGIAAALAVDGKADWAGWGGLGLLVMIVVTKVCKRSM